MDQVKTIYKISQILSQAFKEVNDVCAHYLADQSLQNGGQKHAEKKPSQEKPKQKSVPVQEPQPKKEQKKQTKISAPQKQNPKPVQQSKKQVQPKQTQQNDNKILNLQRPKQPLSAFFLFQQDQKENVKKVHPNSGVTDISKMMGEIWRGLQQHEKAPYVTKAEELKKKYEKDMKIYYEKHPEQKSKKQLKKEKAQQKKQGEVKEAPAPNVSASKQSRKPIVVEEENSESI